VVQLSEPARIWKRGERCRATAGGRSVIAVVGIASPNGKSIALEFDALVTPKGAYLRGMAILWDSQRNAFFECMRTGEQVTLDEVT
jgi:hypothetical protein